MEGQRPKKKSLNYRRLQQINWNNWSSDRKSEELLDLMEDKFMLVNLPTHQTGNIHDLVLTDQPSNIIGIMNVGNLLNSDHCAILVVINIEPGFNSSNQLVFVFRKADFEGMEVVLSNTDWPKLFQNKDADQCWMTFRETVQSISSHFIPQVPRPKKKNRPQWMTKTVVRMSTTLQDMKSHSQHTKTMK